MATCICCVHRCFLAGTSDPLLLAQNRNCDAIELQYHSMDGGIHP